MGPVLSSPGLRAALAGLAVAGTVAALSACSAQRGGGTPDLIAGKQLFVSKCGSCHTLARAQTKGTVGPNLDEAFQDALHEGFGTTAVRGVIYKQILYPNRLPNSDGIKMPAKLVSGQ